MKKTKSLEFKVETNSREYRFIVPEDGPLGEIFDAGAEFLLYISDLMKHSVPKKPQSNQLDKGEEVTLAPAGFEEAHE